MRWLRPTVDEGDGAVAEVEAQLASAAHEAPPSGRAEEIRAALLEDAGRDAMPVLALPRLALAAGALLLTLVIGVGVPVVGSFVTTLVNRGTDAIDDVSPVPSPPDDADRDVTEIPMPTDGEFPTREVPVSPSPNAADLPGDDDVAPGNAGPPETHSGDSQPPSPAPATPSPSSSDRPPGSGPPSPVPSPPPIGPPPGTPGG